MFRDFAGSLDKARRSRADGPVLQGDDGDRDAWNVDWQRLEQRAVSVEIQAPIRRNSDEPSIPGAVIDKGGKQRSIRELAVTATHETVEILEAHAALA
jgi:hypothetical protein